jgi:hypothetical protein
MLVGCDREVQDVDYAARVGDQYLTHAELNRMLSALRVGSDTVEARKQIIEQWVTRAVLYEEALRRNLDDEPAVQERIRRQQQSVLVNELTTQLHSGRGQASFSDADVQAYYDEHRRKLRLREPFVHVFFLTTRSLRRAQTVQSTLRASPKEQRADKWARLVATYAQNTSEARELAARYHPQDRLFRTSSPLHRQLRRLRPGETAPIFEMDSLYHVLHLVDRADAGTIPEPAWVEAEIRRRLRLRARKQMYAREVERLRNEARARGALDVR